MLKLGEASLSAALKDEVAAAFVGRIAEIRTALVERASTISHQHMTDFDWSLRVWYSYVVICYIVPCHISLCIYLHLPLSIVRSRIACRSYMWSDSKMVMASDFLSEIRQPLLVLTLFVSKPDGTRKRVLVVYFMGTRMRGV